MKEVELARFETSSEELSACYVPPSHWFGCVGTLNFFDQKAQLVELMHVHPAHWRPAGGVCTPHGRALAAPWVVWSVDHVFHIEKGASWRVGGGCGVASSSRKSAPPKHHCLHRHCGAFPLLDATPSASPQHANWRAFRYKKT